MGKVDGINVVLWYTNNIMMNMMMFLMLGIVLSSNLLIFLHFIHCIFTSQNKTQHLLRSRKLRVS